MEVRIILVVCFIVVQNLPVTLKAKRHESLLTWIGNSLGPYILNKARQNYTPIQNVSMYLFTRYNPTVSATIRTDDMQSVRRSYFDYRNPTRIIIHGWDSDSDDKIITSIRDAYLSIGPHNVIMVNWSEKTQGEYPIAVVSIPDVAAKVAAFIDFMTELGYLHPENLTIVGHSLGAHISGNAARIIKSGQIHTIVGLDPAGVYLPYNSSPVRLRYTDAYYVESIQTNSALTSYVEPVGRATFYPNGGRIQPGCSRDPDIGCSHYRSCLLFAEAIRINGFPSIQCSDYNQAKEKNCGRNYSQTVRMGAPSNADIAYGVYYVPTSRRSPFAARSYRKPKGGSVSRLHLY